jgi:glutamyl-tRNA reductase
VSLLLLSASYDDVPLEQLDALEQRAETIAQALRSDARLGTSGIVTLATCNRLELYLDAAADGASAADAARMIIAQAADLSPAECARYVHDRVGDAAVHHLFRVTAGLDSMVIGEEEIAGQVKRAFVQAQERGELTPELHRAFERALSAAKDVTSSTGLGAAGRSTITVALDHVVAMHPHITARPVLIIGTGAHARVVVATLSRLGFANISVFSNSGRASEFAAERDVTAVPPAGLSDAVARAELIIGCSGTQRNLITADALATHGARPLIVVDVALAPDFEPAAAALAHVELIDLDVIRKLSPHVHEESVAQAEGIVDAAVEQWQKEVRGRTLDPFVTAVRRKLFLWIDEEVARVRVREGDEAAEIAEHTLTRLANEMLHEPITKAKELAGSGDEDEYRKALLVLFGGSHD